MTGWLLDTSFYDIMARPIRVEFPDAVYHVTARGNERQPIVREDPDRERFLETLEQMVQRFGVAIHAYCLMLNTTTFCSRRRGRT